jgi:hypothetical protein
MKAVLNRYIVILLMFAAVNFIFTSCKDNINDDNNMDSNWNILCLIVKDVNTTEQIGETPEIFTSSMTDVQIEIAKQMFQKFKFYFNSMANGQINVSIDVRISDTQLKTLTNLGGLYSPMSHDIYPLALQYLNTNSYDQVVCLFASNDDASIPFLTVGLGAMRLNGVWYSSVRFIPCFKNDCCYPNVFDCNDKTVHGCLNKQMAYSFVEVLIHEFLHTFDAGIMGVNIIDNQPVEWGLHYYDRLYNNHYNYLGREDISAPLTWDFYYDVMNNNVPTSSGKIGIPPETYKKR